MLLWLLLRAGVATAQTPPIPWLPDSVLSAVVVRAMVADHSGYLWIATTDGIQRYDGYQTVPLAKLLAPGAAAPAGYMHAVVCDSAGRLWLGGKTGLYRLVPTTGQLTRIVLPNLPEDPAPGVQALWLDRRTRRLWVGYGTGLVLTLDLTHPVAPARAPRPLREEPISFAPAPNLGVWLTTYNGQVHQLDAQGQLIRQVQLPSEYLIPIPGTQPQQFVSSHARYETDPRTGQLHERQRWLPAPEGGTQSFKPLLDTQGRPVQWLVAQQQIALQWGAAGQVPKVTRSPVTFYANEPSTRYTLFRDPHQLYWTFSPEERGCYKGGNAGPIRPLPIVRQVRPPSVRGITRLPDGRLLVSSYSGVFTQAAGQPAGLLHPMSLTREGRPWPALLYSMLVTQKGQLFFADESDTFGELDTHTGVLTYHASAIKLQGRTLCQTRTGTIWGGTTSGLYVFEEKQRAWVRYRNQERRWPLHGLEVRRISEDALGTLWLATNGGLFALSPTTGTLQHYGTTEATPNRRLPTDDVLCVSAAPQGHVWLGTRAHGLLHVSATRGLLSNLGPEQGLPSATIATLLPDAAGALWVGTYAGLVYYRPSTGQLKVYGSADGLANPELNQQAAYRAADGTCFFGGVGGVFRVDATGVAGGVEQEPQLLLTAQAAGGQPAQPRLAHAPVGPLVLTNTMTEAGYNLALDDFRAPALNRFFYQLLPTDDGVDTTVMQQTSHHLRLRGLAPGSYTLAVWGQTPAGRRTAKRRLRVEVARPWWQHPLALLSAAGLLVGVGVGLQKLHGRRVLREARLRTRIAADLHDEVGALLTRVNLRAELLQEPSSADELRADAYDLLLDSRAALTMMRDVVWSIDASADTLGALRDRLHDHLDATAKTRDLQATLTIHDLPDALPLSPSLRQQLYLVAKEAITNVVRHAPTATCLTLILQRQGATLTLTIHNDGEVAPPSATHGSGMGLRNMQRRAELLGGQLTAGPAPEGGWRVSLRVPYRDSLLA
ncbi:sensor histidine kinase [Hymenobacter crusticola]|uniref:sensor histidine kinase n=1 Tax=Hymenobacter crusticola TaxID=1770526 RepID=UPI001C4FB366|nr:ATP-binding protein [Hymenobacter crusticola]